MIKEYKNTGYLVDSNGTVYGKTASTLKPSITKKGYHKVSLSLKGGLKMTRAVHRMVAETFIPNPENLPEVNHVDGDKSNNSLDNLEWVTTKQNKQHAMEVLGHGYGETHSQATLTTEQVVVICEMIQDGYRTVDIVKSLGVETEKVRSIRKRGCWKHISKDYIFPTGKSDHGMSDSTFLWICHMLEAGHSGVNILKMYNGVCKLSVQTISNVKTRKLRPELSKEFKF